MKYCGQCGNQLGTGRFCSRCGAPTSGPTDSADTTVPRGPTSPPPTSRYPLYADELTTGPTTPPPSYPAPTMPPPSAPPGETAASSSPAGRHARPDPLSDDLAPDPNYAAERTAVHAAVSDQTAERPAIRVAPDPAPHPQVPSLAETAVRPAVVDAEATREHASLSHALPRREHSVWEQTFWVLFVFLVIVTIIGVALLL